MAETADYFKDLKSMSMESLIRERLHAASWLYKVDQELFNRRFEEIRRLKRKPKLQIGDLQEVRSTRKAFTSRAGARAPKKSRSGGSLDDLLKQMPKEQLAGLAALLDKKKKG